MSNTTVVFYVHTLTTAVIIVWHVCVRKYLHTLESHLQLSLSLCPSEGEEVLKGRVLLLQLMQNCFPMLPNPLESREPEESREPNKAAAAVASPSTSNTGEPLNDSVRAVWELYTHLCHSKKKKKKKSKSFSVEKLLLSLDL